MNKKQAIERIQELIATEEINGCLEILRQPMTLAEFLGWEEDVIYVDKDNIPHRINKNGLLILENNEWKHNHQYTFNNYCISLSNAIYFELTYSQLGDLAENIEKLKERMAVVLVAKCLAYGEKFFENEEKNNE